MDLIKNFELLWNHHKNDLDDISQCEAEGGAFSSLEKILEKLRKKSCLYQLKVK